MAGGFDHGVKRQRPAGILEEDARSSLGAGVNMGESRADIGKQRGAIGDHLSGPGNLIG